MNDALFSFGLAVIYLMAILGAVISVLFGILVLCLLVQYLTKKFWRVQWRS